MKYGLKNTRSLLIVVIRRGSHKKHTVQVVENVNVVVQQNLNRYHHDQFNGYFN